MQNDISLCEVIFAVGDRVKSSVDYFFGLLLSEVVAFLVVDVLGELGVELLVGAGNDLV
jgi:hypothetical protein